MNDNGKCKDKTRPSDHLYLPHKEIAKPMLADTIFYDLITSRKQFGQSTINEDTNVVIWFSWIKRTILLLLCISKIMHFVPYLVFQIPLCTLHFVEVKFHPSNKLASCETYNKTYRPLCTRVLAENTAL